MLDQQKMLICLDEIARCPQAKSLRLDFVTRSQRSGTTWVIVDESGCYPTGLAMNANGILRDRRYTMRHRDSCRGWNASRKQVKCRRSSPEFPDQVVHASRTLSRNADPA